MWLIEVLLTPQGSAASSDTANKGMLLCCLWSILLMASNEVILLLIEVHDAARNLESLNLSSLLEMFQSVLVTREEEEKRT